MKQCELLQYRDCFNNIDDWGSLTETLDKQTIRSIKRLMLRPEVYETFDFTPSDLIAIEKLQIGRKESFAWNGGSEKAVSASFDRINSTVELIIKENGKEIKKSKVSVSEDVIEFIFREDIERKIYRDQMEKENNLPMKQMLDAPVSSGTVTWYKNDQVVFCTSDEYGSVNVQHYIDLAKKTIIEAIEYEK